MDKKNTAKAVISRSAFCTIYHDGSIDVICRKCGKIDYLKPDSKMAIQINQIPEAGEDYRCLNCWKENRDALKEREKGQRRDEIAYAQSWNLAVNLVPRLLSGFNTNFHDAMDTSFLEDYQKELSFWQKWFYEQLTNGRNNRIN